MRTTSSIVARRRRAAFLLTYVLILTACSGGDTPSPRIASDVFVSREDGTVANEVAVLSGVFDVDVAVTALERAGARFSLVDNRGTEYATEADVEAAEQRYVSGDFYTPNYVAAPKVLDTGIELYVDCKGVIPPPMAATFRRILREELQRAGITDATVRNVPE
ncbi:MAG: hypothetical protein ACRD12_12940 [Acidimicrobiales bacterium]